MIAPLFIATLAASAVGSVHCVAMCGPLMGLHRGARGLRLALVHSAGRLVTYALIGAASGLFGSVVDVAGQLGSVQRAATMLAGLVLVGGGLWSGAVHLGIVRRDRAVIQPNQRSMFSRSLVQIRTRRPTLRAWLVGVLTGLIPCGWLWAFAVAAAGTGHATAGALVMLAFWLGTLPAMVGLHAFAGPIISRLRARMPVATALAVIAIGLGTLAIRWQDGGSAPGTAPHCHRGGRSS